MVMFAASTINWLFLLQSTFSGIQWCIYQGTTTDNGTGIIVILGSLPVDIGIDDVVVLSKINKNEAGTLQQLIMH